MVVLETFSAEELKTCLLSNSSVENLIGRRISINIKESVFGKIFLTSNIAFVCTNNKIANGLTIEVSPGIIIETSRSSPDLYFTAKEPIKGERFFKYRLYINPYFCEQRTEAPLKKRVHLFNTPIWVEKKEDDCF